MLQETNALRVDWVDYAKGWCIILVVMMHSTLGVSEAMGQHSFLNDFVAWARPFRMPDFFLVAGLFLSRTIDKPWRVYLDRKLVHFLYFYLLWTLIQGLPKLAFADGATAESVMCGLAFALIEPFGTMWFIYLLPIFFVVTRFARRTPVEIVLLIAVLLQLAGIDTSWTVIDEFASRFVFFYAGYAFASEIFAFAERVRGEPGRWFALLLVWGCCNGLAVHYGIAALPGVSLLLGFAGAGAVVAFSALLAEARAATFLRQIGARSINIYLAFVIPMAATRVALLKWDVFSDASVVATIVTIVAIATPLALAALTRGTRASFLFRRPDWFHLTHEAQAPGSGAGEAPKWASIAH